MSVGYGAGSKPRPPGQPLEVTSVRAIRTGNKSVVESESEEIDAGRIQRRVMEPRAARGTTEVTEAFTLTSRLTPAVLSANQNNYEPDGFLLSAWIRLSASTPVSITGFGRDGLAHAKVVMNVGSSTITLVHESASSTANKRLSLKSAANFALAVGAAVWLVYDTGSDRWRLIGA